MRHLALSLTTALVLTSLLPLSAMNNADLIKLKNAEMSDETILASIGKEPANYDTSADGLIELKKAGLSEAIIQQAMARNSETSRVTASAPAGEEPSVSAPVAAHSELFSVQSPSISPPMINPVVGNNYFTRYSFYQEDGKYITTNYARGSLVPINTPIKLVAMSGDKLRIKRLDNNSEIKVENARKYSGKNINEIASIMFASEKTPIEKLVPTLTSAISSGEMRLGMTKEQVLLARGYPPAHETPSIDGDRWVYWSSRFIKQTILFADGRVVEGRGLQ